MIYCVVPEALEGELYERLVSYYEDDPNVTVIVNRRRKERRARGSSGVGRERRIRDRRRPRVMGDFPSTEPPDE